MTKKRQKKTAQELREKAAMLLERAKQIENERALRIGKLVIEHESNKFKEFDLETFKKQIADIN